MHRLCANSIPFYIKEWVPSWLRWWRVCLQCKRPGSIPGSGRSPGEGSGKLLQYSCLENPVDRAAWQASVHGVTESDTTERTHTFTFECLLIWVSVGGPGTNHPQIPRNDCILKSPFLLEPLCTTSFLYQRMKLLCDIFIGTTLDSWVWNKWWRPRMKQSDLSLNTGSYRSICLE